MANIGDTKILVQVIQDLSSARSLMEVMALVRTAARKIATADGATFVLRDNGMCFYADEDAIEPLWKGQRFPLTSCISGWSMLHKEALIVEDIYKDPRIPIAAYSPTFVKSLAITPIRQQAPIGAIGTYWKEQTVPTAEQMEQLQALANSASVALENVGLYSALEQRIEELKEANRAKDEFLMTVSHELRTPLNSILGWSDILKDMTWQDADLNEGLNSISRNAHGQAQIIEDLLDSSRIVLGRFSLQKDELEFMDIVNEAVEQSFEKADKKNIQIDFRNALSSARVDGEGRRLRQIIKNILDNAIKFSPEGSTVYVDVEKMGPNLCVTVRDQGVGMSEELVTSLYDRFKQVDASTTRKFGGLGLGLSLAHYLAEAHGGRITAESEGEGHGSTFRFILPEKLALFSDQNLTL